MEKKEAIGLPLTEKNEKGTDIKEQFNDLATAEDYLLWKKSVPKEVRDIIEGAITGAPAKKPQTGLKLVDQYLATIIDLTKGGQTEEAEKLDERVREMIQATTKTRTKESTIDTFEYLPNPAVSWEERRKIYETQLAAVLEYLAEESLTDEREARCREDGETGEQKLSAPDDNDIPPDSEDAVSSMEHGVEKSGEKGKAYFSVSPFYGGYYKQHIYDRFDARVGRWRKHKENKFTETEREDIDILGKRVLFGRIRAGKPLAIPLPYGWSIEKESLKINAPEGSFGLKKNQYNIRYLAVRGEGVFDYEMTIGRKSVPDEGKLTEDSEAGSSLPEELDQKIKELEKSSLQFMARARSLVRFIRDHLEYSNDPDSYKKYISDTEKYFTALWQERKADCYVSNTLAVKALLEAGFKARFVGGFYCKEKNDDGSAGLGASNGHAWLEVWDEIGRKWTRLDATPKGDPNMDEEKQEQDLSEDQEGDYGQQDDEIMSEEEIEKKIKELRARQQGAQKSEKSLADLRFAEFAGLAGCSEQEAQRFHDDLERVRKIKNEQGTSISELLREEWRRIVEENIIDVSTYKGPVRMREGRVLGDPVGAFLDIKAGETNPIGFEKKFIVPQIKRTFGGINIYFSFDLSGSMAEADFVSGLAKAEVQADCALLFADSLMQAAIVSERESSGGDNILPIKIMVTLASGTAIPVLPLTDKWGPKEQWAFYSGLRQIATGGTPTAETLGMIENSYLTEKEKLKKRSTPADNYPLEYVVEMTDGAPNNVNATIAMHKKLIEQGVVVRSIIIGGAPIDETGMYDKDGNPLKSFSQIPSILAKDIVGQFQKLRPEKIE